MSSTQVREVLPRWLVANSAPASAANNRCWQIAALASVLVATMVNGLVGWSAVRPSFPFDEVQPLQMSRVFAGLPIPAVDGAGYYPGWSVVMVPLWWISGDPVVVYRLAVVLAFAIGLITIWPLSRLVTEFGLSGPQSITVAGLVMALPSRAIQADYVMSERLLFLLVVCSFVAAWRLWDAPSWQRAAGFGVLIAAVQFTHIRMGPMTGAAVIWLVLFALRNRRVAIVALAVTVPLSALALWGGSQINDAVFGGFSQGERTLDEITSTRPSLILRVGLGQVWNQIVGSFGLFVVGAVALAVLAWRELRSLRVGKASWLLAATLAIWMLSVLTWSRDKQLYATFWPRLDVWIYGRYVEPVTAVIVAAGLAIVVRRVRLAPLLVAAGIAILIMIPLLFWVAPGAPTWAAVTPAHIAGVMPWQWALPSAPFPEDAWIVPTLTNANRFWLLASLTAIVAMIIFGLLRKRALAAVTVAGLLFGTGSVIGNDRSDKFQADNGDPGAIVSTVRQLEADYGPIDVAYDRGCGRPGFGTGSGQNYLGYYLLPTVLRVVNSAKDPAGAISGTLVIGCAEWPLGQGVGARRYRGVESRSSVLWVLPGRLQDSLVANGKME